MSWWRNRWFWVLAVALGGGAWFFSRESSGSAGPLLAPVRQGPFDVRVTTAGELRAREFVEMVVPEGANAAEVYQIKIASLIPEGTLVQAGDVVGELDRAPITTKITEVGLALTKAQSSYEQTVLDSTLTLSKARDDILNLELSIEEKRLVKEQSAYETPAVQRQAALDLEKAERALVQARKDYQIREEQAQAKMRSAETDVVRVKNQLAALENVLSQFTIRAPKAGMVIYVKEWNGRKRTVGSQVSPWDGAIATLPDLTRMESITYVNEIDLRKVAVGQPVRMTLDADPDRRFNGVVASVANMGEQRPNSDAKVFEVVVTVTQADTSLRPGMTTSNGVIVTALPQALFVPLEAIHADSSVAFVYRSRQGSITRQEVETGPMSDNEVVIHRGVDVGDDVLLLPPASAERYPLQRLPAQSTPTTPPSTPSVPTPASDSGDTATSQPTPRPAGPDSLPVSLALGGA